MDIATYVLVVRNADGDFELARESHNTNDLPAGFEARYADFLFEFAESRIQCHRGQDIFLLKGSIDISSIAQQPDFTSAFKALLRAPRDYSSWELINSKRALSVTDEHYRERLMKHLRNRHGHQTQATASSDSQVA